MRQKVGERMVFVQHGLQATLNRFRDRGLLAIPLQDRVSQVWWHILLRPQTEWTWGATAGHARANYPSETWRESLSCIHTHVHTESTDTFNEAKQVLPAFPPLPNFISILKKMQTLTLRDSPEVWNCSNLNIRMHRRISSSHLYACCADVCLIWCLCENQSDQWSRW